MSALPLIVSFLAWIPRQQSQILVQNTAKKMALSKLRSSRGNEAQTKEKMEPPHVGCYGFEISSRLCRNSVVASSLCADKPNQSLEATHKAGHNPESCHGRARKQTGQGNESLP